MRKIKEFLRLRFELQLGQREIARACSISQGAVHNYLKKAAATPGDGAFDLDEDGIYIASSRNSVAVVWVWSTRLKTLAYIALWH